jgi:hypothetical protein
MTACSALGMVVVDEVIKPVRSLASLVKEAQELLKTAYRKRMGN